TPVVRQALLAGEIDLYVEDTGNAGLFFNDAADPAWKDLDRGYELGARLDYAANRIVWLTAARASNAWALAVRSDIAQAYQLRTMSDFGRWVACGGHVVLICSAEFANAGTLRSLERTYGFMLRSAQLIVLAGGETGAAHSRARCRHQWGQHRHGIRHRWRHRRRSSADPGGRSARSAGVCSGSRHSRKRPAAVSADRRDREAAHG